MRRLDKKLGRRYGLPVLLAAALVLLCPSPSESVQAETVRAEAVQAETVRAESVRAEAVQAKTVQAETDGVEKAAARPGDYAINGDLVYRGGEDALRAEPGEKTSIYVDIPEKLLEQYDKILVVLYDYSRNEEAARQEVSSGGSTYFQVSEAGNYGIMAYGVKDGKSETVDLSSYTYTSSEKRKEQGNGDGVIWLRDSGF